MAFLSANLLHQPYKDGSRARKHYTVGNEAGNGLITSEKITTNGTEIKKILSNFNLNLIWDQITGFRNWK